MIHPTPAAAKRSERWMTLTLAVAVVAAVALAIAASRMRPEPVAVAEPPLSTALPKAPIAVPSNAAPAGPSGQVLETIAVSKYTYLRLRAAEGEVWAAVPSADIAVGQQVALENAMRMDDFKSSTLKRTFKTIYFGNLAAEAATPTPKFAALDVLALDDDSPLPAGHPDIGGDTPLAAAPSGLDALPTRHPDMAANRSAASVAPVRVEPAHGRNAHVIAELTARRQQLSGQRVRIRGQVTKVTAGIKGRAYFHLRDGAPGAGEATDLVVTAVEPPELGQVATFEGLLRTDVDVGIGYKYALLLEDSVIVPD